MDRNSSNEFQNRFPSTSSIQRYQFHMKQHKFKNAPQWPKSSYSKKINRKKQNFFRSKSSITLITNIFIIQQQIIFYFLTSTKLKHSSKIALKYQKKVISPNTLIQHRINYFQLFELNIIRENNMTSSSPFSKFYRNLVEQQQPYTQTFTPEPLTHETRLQPTSANHAINIFQAAFEPDNKSIPKKPQTKIKVFGLGDKKNKRMESLQIFIKQAQEQIKNDGEHSHNLLDSLESLPENYFIQPQQEPEKQSYRKQLNKLLELSEEISENKHDPSITPNPVQTNKVIAQEQISEHRQKNASKQTESRPERQNQSNSKQYEVLLNKFPLEDIQALINRTESCQILSNGLDRSNAHNKSISAQQSVTSSKIRDIFDHCEQLFINQHGKHNYCADGQIPESAVMQESQIINGGSRANSQIPQSPTKKDKKEVSMKCSTVSQKEKSKISKMSTSKPAIFCIIPKPRSQPKHQTQRMQQATKKERKSVDIKKYLSLDSHYSNQINNLINRYQKVAELKEKKKQISEEISKLATQRCETTRYGRSHYLPHANQLSSYQINEDYFHQGKLSKPSAFSSISPKCEDSKNNINNPFEQQTQLQKQLNKNVQNMQIIIGKFKKISKQMSNNSQEFFHSHYFEESPSSVPAKAKRYDPIKYQVDPQSQNVLPAQQQLHNQCSLSANFKATKHVSSQGEPQANQNQTYLDSIEEIDFSKDYLARASERTNPQFFKPNQSKPKLTARTQKKCSSNIKNHQKVSSSQEFNHPHLNCQCQHAHLAQKLEVLNEKIQRIEKKNYMKLYKARSEQNLTNKTAPKYKPQIKIDKISGESESNQEVDQSIPAQSNVKLEQFPPKDKKSTRHSTEKRKSVSKNKREDKVHFKQPDEPNKYVSENMKSNLTVTEQVINKMKIKFPSFEQTPTKNDSLATIIFLGEQMFWGMLKFAKSRNALEIKKLKGMDNLKAEKFKDFIHYSLPHFEYHLIYSFSGKIYFGQWSEQLLDGEGYKHGYGYYLKPKKYVYEGQFYLNRKHGKGLLNTFKGEIYEGDWRKGKKQGFGILINSMGDIYKGFFEGGKKNGKGQEQLTNGDYYRGQFKSGKLNGEGIYLWADGSLYKGGFKNGLLNGKGCWKSKDNQCYEGQYKDNRKHGKGTYTWNNGVSFTGYFAEDQKIGQRVSLINKNKEGESQSALKKYSKEKKMHSISKQREFLRK